MATQATTKDIREKAGRLGNLEVPAAGIEALGGQVDDVLFLKDVMRRLAESQIEAMPEVLAKQGLVVSRKIDSALTPISKTTVISGNEKERLSRLLSEAVEGATTLLPIVLAFSPEFTGIQKLRAETEKIKAQIVAASVEAEATLQSIKQAAGKTSVAAYARSFSRQSRIDYGLAAVSAIVVVVLAAIAYFTAANLFNRYLALWQESNGSEHPTFPAAIAVGGIATLSVLFFGVLLAARVFRAQIHNATLNSHRSNALNTFEAFVAGAADPAAKAAILNFAAQAIFTPQPTGFTTTKDGEMIGHTTLLKMVSGGKPDDE